jgi:hypothetical protein
MTIPTRVRGRLSRGDADARRTQRVGDVLRLAERFVYDLGMLLAGNTADLEPYVEATVAARLRTTLQHVQRSGRAMRPDFGDYAEVRISGDVLNLVQPVQVAVEFDDRSTWSASPVEAAVRARRRVRLELVFDAAITTVLDHRVELV